MFEIVIVKRGNDGSISVSVQEDFDDEEKAEWEKDGSKVIALYPLQGSLQALAVLVCYSLGHPDNFGHQIEELLTKMAQDIYKKGFESAIETYGIKENEE